MTQVPPLAMPMVGVISRYLPLGSAFTRKPDNHINFESWAQMDIIMLKNCDNQKYTATKNHKTTHRSNKKQTSDVLVNISSCNQAHSQKF